MGGTACSRNVGYGMQARTFPESDPRCGEFRAVEMKTLPDIWDLKNFRIRISRISPTFFKPAVTKVTFTFDGSSTLSIDGGINAWRERMRSCQVMRHVSARKLSPASIVCRIRNLADGVPAASRATRWRQLRASVSKAGPREP